MLRIQCDPLVGCGSNDKAMLSPEAHRHERVFQAMSHQDVHQPLLTLNLSNKQHHIEHLTEEVVMPVAGRGNQHYCDWWRDQFIGHNNLQTFSVRLVGDASSPELFTPWLIMI